MLSHANEKCHQHWKTFPSLKMAHEWETEIEKKGAKWETI